MKYMIRPLEAHCVNFLLENIDCENIFTIFQFCVDCDVDKRLMEKCLTILRDTHWTTSDFKESFLKLSHKCLSLFLEDDFLDAIEVYLFNAVRFFMY